ncbi:MAG: phosphoglycerate kinase [Deltaproteobacteria bacterium]|nr:phosphoglycerate kinase [Deltaproteobacteria bacterium]
MKIRSIESLDLRGKRVFIRVDFNVPIKDGVVKNDKRIRSSLDTINYVLSKNAKVILASHLGRPKGGPDKKYSLLPVGERLRELLNRDVKVADDCIGDGVKKLVADMKDGEILLLENLRFHKEEEENNENFAKELASLCDVYINDAFGTAHRAHASTEGMAHFVKEKAAGFLMLKEVKHLSSILLNPEKPFVTILGGAKVSDKINVITNLMKKVDAFVICGAMAYTFLKSLGFKTGRSLVEDDKLDVARQILENAKKSSVEIILPEDHVVAKDENDEPRVAPSLDIEDDMVGYDIGPRTINKFSTVIAKAKTIFFNGPAGLFENPKFANGTNEIVKIVANLKGVTTVAGGGDTVTAIESLKLEDKFTHISTGGGASLEFMEGKELPGIKILEE